METIDYLEGQLSQEHQLRQSADSYLLELQQSRQKAVSSVSSIFESQRDIDKHCTAVRYTLTHTALLSGTHSHTLHCRVVHTHTHCTAVRYTLTHTALPSGTHSLTHTALPSGTHSLTHTALPSGTHSHTLHCRQVHTHTHCTAVRYTLTHTALPSGTHSLTHTALPSGTHSHCTAIRYTLTLHCRQVHTQVHRTAVSHTH